MAVTTADLILKCKIGLQLDILSSDLDGLLEQKILMVKNYMSNAGVTDINMDSELGIGTIVLGVTDVWIIQGGKATFSDMFVSLVNQLHLVSRDVV